MHYKGHSRGFMSIQPHHVDCNRGTWRKFCCLQRDRPSQIQRAGRRRFLLGVMASTADLKLVARRVHRRYARLSLTISPVAPLNALPVPSLAFRSARCHLSSLVPAYDLLPAFTNKWSLTFHTLFIHTSGADCTAFLLLLRWRALAASRARLQQHR